MKKGEAELENAFRAVVDEQTGRVSIGGEPFVLVHREALADIQREMEAILGRGVEGILVRAGYQRGRTFAMRLATLVSGDEAAFVEGLRVFSGRTGLFRLSEFKTEGERTLITVADSIVGRTYGRTQRPVCHYVRGFLLAVAEAFRHERDLACKERRCAALGDGECAFEVTPFLGGSEKPAQDETE